MARAYALEAARENGSGYRPTERLELLAELLLRARQRRDQAEDRLELYQSALTGFGGANRILESLESEIGHAGADVDAIATKIATLKKQKCAA